MLWHSLFLNEKQRFHFFADLEAQVSNNFCEGIVSTTVASVFCVIALGVSVPALYVLIVSLFL